ncbi:DUF1707 domain-containing protein [Solirubrobacter sp. CPCC 204708]|uniref:DUF1707 domain-containing protein n=1 Tax=Solirubrobacter deserti TaxID=2282478 RepID=A0ABT4RLC7_9ACTN|nr:DUF1707 domain-containing protein [Solirubrobacter deserti]MBE2320456.1 DUF1707 domain-containing protein [Solirubrobacter deserti]MDA0139353.1 DUF1707 domain-containing protein [Solirubrobacter deserti]
MSSWQRPTPELRASDAERERVVDFLRESALVGRIDHDELEERIGLAYAAVTRGDLERLLVDLPRGARPPAPRPRRAPAPAKRREPSAAMVLVGLSAIAIPMIVLTGVVMAIVAVVALSVLSAPFVIVALLVAAAMRRRRPPGPGPGWRSAHYG